MGSRVFITSFALLIVLCNVGFAWWGTVIWTTHDKITADAIDYLSPEEYPDIVRFASKLREGGRTEAHDPPGVPRGAHRWFPEAQNWWNYREDSNVKCALEWYEENAFENAYKTIGYMLHNVQDLRVPAHMYICIHGVGEDLEAWVMVPGNHQYATGNTMWVFVENGWSWYYWSNDYSDDDDENGWPDYSSLPDIPDYGDVFNPEWGIHEYEFGSYGFDPDFPPRGGLWWGPIPFGDPPGLNKGQDYFWEKPNASIAHQQLKKAYDDTIALLMDNSKALPPLIGSVSFTPGKVVGPLSPVEISFEAQENRKSRVRITVTAPPASWYIKDTSGVEWNSKPVDLLPTGSEDMLPWKSMIIVQWAGDTSHFPWTDLGEGEYTIKTCISDYDGHSSSSTGTIKYDKTPPTATVSVNLTYPH